MYKLIEALKNKKDAFKNWGEIFGQGKIKTVGEILECLSMRKTEEFNEQKWQILLSQVDPKI